MYVCGRLIYGGWKGTENLCVWMRTNVLLKDEQILEECLGIMFRACSSTAIFFAFIDAAMV